jgi:hypothetical protein
MVDPHLSLRDILAKLLEHGDQLRIEQARKLIRLAAVGTLETLRDSLPESFGWSLDKLHVPRGRPSKKALAAVEAANERGQLEWAERRQSGDRVPMIRGPNVAYDEASEATREELRQVADGKLDLVKRQPDGRIDLSELTKHKWLRLKSKWMAARRQVAIDRPTSYVVKPTPWAMVAAEVVLTVKMRGFNRRTLEMYIRNPPAESNDLTVEMVELDTAEFRGRLVSILLAKFPAEGAQLFGDQSAVGGSASADRPAGNESTPESSSTGDKGGRPPKWEDLLKVNDEMKSNDRGVTDDAIKNEYNSRYGNRNKRPMATVANLRQARETRNRRNRRRPK